MTAAAFVQNIDNAWGPDKTDGAQFRRDRLLKHLTENYNDAERDELWGLVEKTCEYRPRVSALNKLMPGRSRNYIKFARTVGGYSDLPFSTKSAERFAEDLRPIFAVKVSGDVTNDDMLTDEQRATMRSRSSAFFDILLKLMGRPKGVRE